MKKKHKTKPKQDITMKSVFTMCCKMKTCALCGENLSHLPQGHQGTEERVKVPNWYSLEMHCCLSVSFFRYSWESPKALIYSNCIMLAGFICFLFNWIFSLQVKLAWVLNVRIQKSISHVPVQAPAKPLGDLDSIDFLPHIQSYDSLNMMILHMHSSLIILANYILKGQKTMQMHMLTFAQLNLLLPHTASLAMQRQNQGKMHVHIWKCFFFQEQQMKFAAAENPALQISSQVLYCTWICGKLLLIIIIKNEMHSI